MPKKQQSLTLEAAPPPVPSDAVSADETVSLRRELVHVDDNAPSCSLAEALQKQDLFINQAVSTFALQLLWRLFREGMIEQHGAFINLETGRVNPLPVPAHIGMIATSKPKKKAA